MAEASRRVLLIGSSVGQSLSVVFQNAGFEALALDFRYQPIDVGREGLAGLIDDIRGDWSVLGANVTIPHKETVMPLLDELDPRASAIGAVNTISRDGTRLKGWNTDGQGFDGALAELGFEVSGKVVAVVGAGGAARAVVASLIARADRVYVLNRTLARAEDLCRELGVERGGPASITELDEVLAKAQLVVNATPADLSGAASIVAPRLYFDLRSRTSVSGRLMLLHQGLYAFQIWTGRPAPEAAMRVALMRAAQVTA